VTKCCIATVSIYEPRSLATSCCFLASVVTRSEAVDWIRASPKHPDQGSFGRTNALQEMSERAYLRSVATQLLASLVILLIDDSPVAVAASLVRCLLRPNESSFNSRSIFSRIPANTTHQQVASPPVFRAFCSEGC